MRPVSVVVVTPQLHAIDTERWQASSHALRHRHRLHGAREFMSFLVRRLSEAAPAVRAEGTAYLQVHYPHVLTRVRLATRYFFTNATLPQPVIDVGHQI